MDVGVVMWGTASTWPCVSLRQRSALRAWSPTRVAGRIGPREHCGGVGDVSRCLAPPLRSAWLREPGRVAQPALRGCGHWLGALGAEKGTQQVWDACPTSSQPWRGSSITHITQLRPPGPFSPSPGRRGGSGSQLCYDLWPALTAQPIFGPQTSGSGPAAVLQQHQIACRSSHAAGSFSSW